MALPRDRRNIKENKPLGIGLGDLSPIENKRLFGGRPKPPDPKENAVPAGTRNGAEQQKKAGAFEILDTTPADSWEALNDASARVVATLARRCRVSPHHARIVAGLAGIGGAP